MGGMHRFRRNDFEMFGVDGIKTVYYCRFYCCTSEQVMCIREIADICIFI
jgi:hypothetical protein